MKRIDLTGQRFGRWTVLNYSCTGKHSEALWSCKCDCGAVKEVRGNDLRRGKSLSCKCLNYEVSTSHGMSGTKLYQVWANTKARCYDENGESYELYGGRGITVCDKWHTFEGFYEDMGDSYIEGLSIDRIDVNGNYKKDNCRWADAITQQNNRRITKYYTVDGITDSFANLCRTFQVNYDMARGRIRSGWDIAKVFHTPSSRKEGGLTG